MIGLMRRRAISTPRYLRTATGTSPLTLPYALAGAVRSLTITGNSTQSGTPTPAEPIAIANTGDLVTSGDYAGKYAVTVTVGGVTTTLYLDAPLRQGDTYEVRSGKLIQRRAVKVYDGTEAWGKQNYLYYIAFAGKYTSAQCTHFYYDATVSSEGETKMGAFKTGINMVFKPSPTLLSDLNAWKAWVAAQYAAGTPLSVDYELATPAEIDLTGQNITLPNGTATVMVGTITPPAALACTYYGTVPQT